MRKFICRLLTCAVIVGAILAAFCAVVYGLTGGRYARPSYQKGFVYQVRALERQACGTGPKVLLIGGSYLNFGVNMPLFRKLIGRPAYTLGIHSAMGESYVLETAKRFVNPGDTVVYIFEPVRHDDFGMPLIYQTLDGETDMMRDFALHHPILFATTFPEECAHRVHELLLWKLNLGKGRPFEWEGIYHERAFDRQTGDMTFPRECKYKKGQRAPFVTFAAKEIPMESFDILNEFEGHCRKRGARLVIAFIPYLEDAIVPTGEKRRAAIEDYESHIRRNAAAPVIAHQREQLYPLEMMYDREKHLNDRGAEDYTRRLAHDLLVHLSGRD